ncbi:MAG: FAD-dependent oxidoreductase [Intestinimonas sp.]
MCRAHGQSRHLLCRPCRRQDRLCGPCPSPSGRSRLCGEAAPEPTGAHPAVPVLPGGLYGADPEVQQRLLRRQSCGGPEVAYAVGRAQERKKVLVVGGGVAGCEAARVCALRGHDVTLLEAAGQLGETSSPAGCLTLRRTTTLWCAGIPMSCRSWGCGWS